ncbi:TPA: hypothetical protein DCR79_01725 [Patescibacteria group bacterium]|uniref:Uncharacterized protein n=1 Tax=candidate division Kazan bacterium GW2011_GWA1_44_22 TaxID=1620410 RepID=A0A0G1KVX6_UNCK3|nr:MAG: hypothetical protein VE96_C0022G0006 [candidate division Kazan bacterium GW2011_GWA1_44_22]HAR54986.1 hypothetical protein [Patescibacteria group bacterium]HCR41866.1 hypothetical protein [Patescibacteria group bacterium]
MSPELANAIFTLYAGLFILAGSAGYIQRREDPEGLDPAVRALAVINITALLVVATWIVIALGIFFGFSAQMSLWQFVCRYGFLGLIPPLMVAHYEGWPLSEISNFTIVTGVILGALLWFAGFIVWPGWLIMAIIYSRQPQAYEAS